MFSPTCDLACCNALVLAIDGCHFFPGNGVAWTTNHLGESGILEVNTRTRSYKEKDLQEQSMCPMSMMVVMEVWPKTKERQSETTQEDTRAPVTLNSISSQLRMVERYKRNIVVERRWPCICFSNCFSLLGMAIVLRKDNHKALQLLDISIKPDFSASARGNCGTECQRHWQIWMDSSGQHPRNNFGQVAHQLSLATCACYHCYLVTTCSSALLVFLLFFVIISMPSLYLPLWGAPQGRIGALCTSVASGWWRMADCTWWWSGS